VDRNDVPILLMLMTGARASEIGTSLALSPASLDVRRAAMLSGMLGESALGFSDRARRGGESAPTASEADARIALAA
jgi:hypothetical protein